ncbi:MAG: hypothetical protein F6J93_01005 [Oscillatoria sp. SIO1A7]|nr:hypothetical protein [Oscillatoria sp. SIO1A7]
MPSTLLGLLYNARAILVRSLLWSRKGQGY